MKWLEIVLGVAVAGAGIYLFAHPEVVNGLAARAAGSSAPPPGGSPAVSPAVASLNPSGISTTPLPPTGTISPAGSVPAISPATPGLPNAPRSTGNFHAQNIPSTTLAPGTIPADVNGNSAVNNAVSGAITQAGAEAALSSALSIL